MELNIAHRLVASYCAGGGYRLKNGGWTGCGDFVSILGEVGGVGGVQVTTITHQTAADGSRRSRCYYQLRARDAMVTLAPSVRSRKAAFAAAKEIVIGGSVPSAQ